MDGVQLGVSINATVMSDVCSRKKTRVGGYVPFAIFLKKLEPGRPFFPHRGRTYATLLSQNAAICLYLCGIGAVIRGEVVVVLDNTVAVVESKAVGVGGRTERRKAEESDHQEQFESTDPRPRMARMRYRSCRFGYRCLSLGSAW